MKLLKVAASCLNQTPLDWEENLTNVLGAIDDARASKVTLLCLPELCLTGYGCEDTFQAPSVQEKALELLRRIVPVTKGMIVSVGLPVRYHNAVFNCAALVADGALLGLVAKKHLAGDGIHYEPRWFKPWPVGKVASISLDGVEIPFGDLYFDCGGIRLGFEICEDAWVGNRPGAGLSERGVDVILNPSASHFAFGKHETRKRFVLEGSRAFGVTYVYSNLLGNESGRILYDGGALVASAGYMVAMGKRFLLEKRTLTEAVVDVDLTRTASARNQSFRPATDETDGLVECAFDFPRVTLAIREVIDENWSKEEEFTRAVAMGLYDYLRKSRSKGFVISLSGGADSSACACLVSLMARLAQLPEPPLTCVYQATENSSETTRTAAREVAKAVGAEFLELDVNPIVHGYVGIVSKAIKREITWQTDDLAMQNIQARVRAPGVWMIANLKNALLLTTSNRSEAAVGYATMDGDTAGGLNPLGGIDKAFLRRWLRWLQTDGPTGLGPIPALSYVNALEPTAELRPQGSGQTDEKDLMPYEILDAIERAAIRDRKLPIEVVETLAAQFPEEPHEKATQWTEKFFRLWSRNQWKRERYAPSFHLDDENLDPKTWCRFPILSGGYEAELGELREKR